MSRSWLTVLLFLVGAGVVLGAMGYVTGVVVRLDRERLDAQHRAALEESVRLALWRIDASIWPMIALENDRPVEHYRAFYRPRRVMEYELIPIQVGPVLVHSPLLLETSELIHLHFQINSKEKMSSPQNPSQRDYDLAYGYSFDEVMLDSAKARFRQLRAFILEEDWVDELRRRAGGDEDLDGVDIDGPLPKNNREFVQGQEGLGSSLIQLDRSKQELTARHEQYRNTYKTKSQNTVQGSGRAVGEAGMSNNPFVRQRKRLRDGEIGEVTFKGDMQAVWLEDHLMLIRRVVIDDRSYLQGVWLDWLKINSTLYDSVRDLFPEARLRPIRALDDPVDPTRVLASLPAELVPGEPAVAMGRYPSPLHLSFLWPLVIAWVFALFAVGAIGVMLWGSVALGDRKTTFVSAVTHELRTPLTTFALYTDLLVSGKVEDEGKKRSYLQTLRVEAERLSHLVENVLGYARLERGPGGGGVGNMRAIGVDALLEHVGDRLGRRAEQAGLKLEINGVLDRGGAVEVQTDPSAVEQVLYNLVDNSCKYAAGGRSGVVVVDCELTDRWLKIHVKDDGPGVLGKDIRKLFRPFSRSARDAAGSVPGVGLGLALSRRIARRLGGDLRLVSGEGVDSCGADFVLTLPL